MEFLEEIISGERWNSLMEYSRRSEEKNSITDIIHLEAEVIVSFSVLPTFVYCPPLQCTRDTGVVIEIDRYA